MNQNREIAFVHYPHYPDSARVDTMPFVLNTVKKMAELYWKIDLYLWENDMGNYKDVFPKNVHLSFQKGKWLPFIDSMLVRLFPQNFKEYSYHLRFKWGKNYSCAFGVGQIGAYIAWLISKRNHCPLILFNDEFPSAWKKSKWLFQFEGRWDILEKESAKHSRLIVVPDPARIEPLRQELELTGQFFASLPNSTGVSHPVKESDWHHYLNIPDRFKLCFYGGSLTDPMQIPELMISVSHWPENAVLVLNGRNKNDIDYAKKVYAHLEYPGRIFWNHSPLKEDELNSLVSCSTVTFALYRNTEPNIAYMGFASGKLMRSIAAGVPVIASALPSFQFIKENGLGILVNHPNEIPVAVSSILNPQTDYRNNCLKFFQTNCRFETYWDNFCKTFNSATGINLNENT